MTCRAHVGGHIGKAVTGGRINAIFGTDAAGYDKFSNNLLNKSINNDPQTTFQHWTT